MRAELNGLDTADTETGDVGAFSPEDAECFVLAVTASIGAAGERGAELFQFTVCSRSWLAARRSEKGFEFGRHTLVLDRWNSALVKRAIADLCRRTEGATWAEIATSLSRFGHREFEDYRA